MGALDGMSGTGGALGEIKTKTEKETNNIGGKGEKKRGRKAEIQPTITVKTGPFCHVQPILSKSKSIERSLSQRA